MNSDPYITEGIAEYVYTLFPATFTGICVDVGAFDPFWNSNSWIFEKMGWDTYCIEPNPSCIPRLKQYRKNVLEYACGNKNLDDVDLFIFKVEGVGEAAGTGLIDHRILDEGHQKIFSKSVKVKERTLDWLMENEIKRDHIDYLSIDTERSEMDVILGTDLARWKPKVIVIEHFEVDPDQSGYFKSKNYRYVYRIGFNDIYMLEDYYHHRVIY